MAIIVAPYGGGTLRGSIGSTTFQRGRYGNLARQRVMPVNPNTLRQVDTRNTLGYLSSRWGTGLTASQIVNWNAYAASTPWIPSNTILTGQAAFIATNFIPAYIAGFGAESLDAPTTPLMAVHNNLTFVASAATGNVSITATLPGLNANDIWLVEASIVLGPGKNFWKGPFTFQTSFTGTTVLPFIVHNYGATVPAGRKVWLKTRKWDDFEKKVSPMVITPLVFA